MLLEGAAYSAAMSLGGMVTGMYVGDILGAVPTKAAVPATGASATPKATADGTPVSGVQTPRQSLFLAAGYVIAAVVVLLLGSRFLKDARIG